MIIPPFRPDAGELVSSTLNNVFMEANGFGPRPVLSASPGAAVFSSGAQVRGAYAGQVPGGIYEGFVASATKVFRLSATYGYTDLAVTFAIPSGEDEAFAQFNAMLIATNTADGMYAYNMQTPAGLNAISGAPKARAAFVSNNMLFGLGDGTNTQRMANTAFGDYTNWTDSGALKIDIPDGGALTGGDDLGGPYAVVYQQRAVRLITFGSAGGGAPYRIDKISVDIGCVHPRARAVVNGTGYFLSTQGFFSVNGSNGVSNIGAQKVNAWFLANCPDLTKVYLSVDPVNTLIRVRYRSVNCASDIVFTDLLDYNYVEQEFIPQTENTSWVFRMATPGYVLNDLDTFGALNGWSQYPLGSAFWQGGNNPGMAGIDSTGKFGFFNGTAAAATLESNTIGNGLSQLVTMCEPLTDDPAVTVQVGVKDTLANNIAWNGAVGREGSGRAAVRGRGRYQRYRLNHAAGATWSRDTAVEGIVSQAGAGR